MELGIQVISMSPDLRDHHSVERGLRVPAQAGLIHSLSPTEGLGRTWDPRAGGL